MTTAEKKIDLIAWLTQLEDQATLELIEKIRKNSQEKRRKSYLKPISEKELIQSLQEAEADYEAGNIISQEELIEKIKNGKIL
ncbi:MAG: putative toxin-antitoxin system antidote component [Algoriphagus marincola HL-49]|uniref:Putative toxin-antitoxin system antidote component n=1 Tax=Algoriphagus marincola HL-49 TaxID=1305737 RepID=A0A0P7XGX8_9BACT|nr:MAG: putative toxin-antitoxin system antidote component [Algoriphagus marincola HL-49]